MFAFVPEFLPQLGRAIDIQACLRRRWHAVGWHERRLLPRIQILFGLDFVKRELEQDDTDNFRQDSTIPFLGWLVGCPFGVPQFLPPVVTQKEL